METQAFTRRDLETALIEKCWKDAEFKRQVISDTKGMLERHTGQKLPAQLKIFVHKEDANTLHYSIPPAPANLTELSDADLEQVAGGTLLTIAITAGVASAGVSVATAAATKYQW
jgi:hypothetical protein